MEKYVCGFDENGKFLVATVYKGQNSVNRVLSLNSRVVLTEICDGERFELYKRGYVRSAGGDPVAPQVPEPTAEDTLEQAKAERADAVSKIIVTVDGMKFDGDEESQQRVARSIIALEDGETMPWVLYDNTIAEVTKEQLKQVLRLAGQKQSELWVVPYANK